MALQAQARRVPMPVEIEEDSISRYPQETEACVYFCVLEALQNTTKYSHAKRVIVRLSSDDTAIRFSITDDGVGFDPHDQGYGTGLQGMSDRLAAQGGGLEVESATGRGTTISGYLPISAGGVHE